MNTNVNTNRAQIARIFQEGAQTIIGFTFSASLLMDMRAEPLDETQALRTRQLQVGVYECVCVYMYLYVYVCICTCVCMCMCVCVYI